MLCREEAQNLQNVKPKLDAMGVKLVGIVKEWDEAEIKVMLLPLPDLLCGLVGDIRLGVCFCQAGGGMWLGITWQQARYCRRQSFPVLRRSCCLQDFTTKFWSQDLFFDEQKVCRMSPV